MFSSLVRNSTISAVAFGIAGILGLLTVGWIVAAYGFAKLGLIVLARNLLPTGFLAIADFGVSEVATQVIARARAGASWEAASERLVFVFAIAMTAGIVSTLAIFLGAPWAVDFVSTPAEHADVFVNMIRVTALALPLNFVGLVFEGMLKGFERYSWLRLVEVLSGISYALVVLLLCTIRVPFEYLLYAFLLITCIKSAALGVVAWQLARSYPLAFRRWGTEAAMFVRTQCKLMLGGRLIGILQQPIMPFLIAVMFNSSAVAIYDILTRLPRFLKSTFGLVSSAILPASARIEQTLDGARQIKLGRFSFTLSAAITWPFLMALALFSSDILRLWIGPEAEAFGRWQALMLLVPATSLVLGTGQTALLVREKYTQKALKLVLLQVLVQYAIILVLLPHLGVYAFVCGQAAAAACFYPLLARQILREWGLPASLVLTQIARYALVFGAVAGLAWALHWQWPKPGWVMLVASVSAVSCIAFLATLGIALGAEDREAFRRLARTLRGTF